MSVSKLEYIWLDGHKPTQGLRSKTKLIKNFSGELKDTPMWSFDGSSTEQVASGASDLHLKPIVVYKDPDRINGFLVMCEVLEASKKPHETNARATIDDDDNEYWFGFEQEYVLSDLETNKPLGFPLEGFPAPQGPYYCGVGAKHAFGREIVEEHLDLCIDAGLDIEGINSEVMAGQWEFQIFAKGAKSAGDQIWVARFLLERTAEKYGILVDWHPKPVKGDWNGSGMHANFSNELLRTCASKEIFEKVCNAFAPVVKEHIDVYGAHNDLRLTGKHETQSIDKFSYGVSDRGASIRIPIYTVDHDWSGYLEDRRPASNADPYKVAARIIKTIKTIKK